MAGTCIEFALRRREGVQSCHVPEGVAAADDAAIASRASSEASKMLKGETDSSHVCADAVRSPTDLGYMMPRGCFCEPFEGGLHPPRV